MSNVICDKPVLDRSRQPEGWAAIFRFWQGSCGFLGKLHGGTNTEVPLSYMTPISRLITASSDQAMIRLAGQWGLSLLVVLARASEPRWSEECQSKAHPKCSCVSKVTFNEVGLNRIRSRPIAHSQVRQ